MPAVVLDDCLQALYEAQEYMKEYVEISPYEELFEAAKPEVAEKMQKNMETETKTEGAVLKAIHAVKNMIKTIMGAIVDFISRMKMGKEEAASFNAFREACKKDPELRNKKITVKDYRAIQKEYDEILKEIDAKIRAVKIKEETPIEDVVKKAGTVIAKGAKSTAVILASDAALKMAESNMDVAEALKIALRYDDNIMNELEKELGARGAKKWAKKVNAATKITILTRWKTKFNKKKYDCAKDALDATLSEFKSIAKGNVFANPRLAKSLLDNENVGGVVKPVVGGAVKATAKASMFAVKNAGKGATKAGKEFVKGEIVNKFTPKRVKEEREKERKREGVYKPGMEFLRGKKKGNDPDTD